MAQKIFNNWLFRVMSTWFGNYVQSLWNDKSQEFTNIMDTAKSQYASVVYLTQEQYDALSEEEKMDASKVYFIEEE